MNTGRAVSTWRVALLLLVFSSILWLGGVHFRILMGNDLLQWGTLEFEDLIPPEAEREVYRLISVASAVILPAYAVTLLSGTLFLITAPYRLKEHGWLMMSAILFYLFVPVEAFTMTLDVRMLYHEFFTTSDTRVFRELFLARAGALHGAPFVALVGYYTIIVLVVLQPLKRVEARAA